MSHWTYNLAIAGLLLSTAAPAKAFHGHGYGCGCESDCSGAHWCHHGCRSCCNCQGSSSREAPRSVATAPRAAIVESMPVFQMTPGVVTMPMMMAGFARQAPEEPRSREASCNTSKDRLDLLETQMAALDLRMQTIQRSVEIQTRILEEMKADGKFPSRYLTPPPAPAP